MPPSMKEAPYAGLLSYSYSNGHGLHDERARITGISGDTVRLAHMTQADGKAAQRTEEMMDAARFDTSKRIRSISRESQEPSL